MSLKCMTWAFEQELKPGLKCVLLGLADEANDDGDNCHPSMERLAWKASASVRSVRRYLDELEAAPLIVIIRPPKQGRGFHNSYRLLVPWVVDNPSYPQKRVTDCHPSAEKGGHHARIPLRDIYKSQSVDNPNGSGSALPENWNPKKETLRTIHERFPTLDLDHETFHFSNYARSKAIHRVDWEAAFCAWAAEAAKKQANGTKPRQRNAPVPQAAPWTPPPPTRPELLDLPPAPEDVPDEDRPAGKQALREMREGLVGR